MAGSTDDVVRAGGGVVWRPAAGGGIEVALVHRPKYDDWSLPKGKLDDGEDELAAAVREVEEETGLRCDVGPELPSTRYRDNGGRPKVVRYWAMTPVGGEFHPNDEVDDLVWLPPSDAQERLSYGHDRQVVAAAARTVSQE